MRYLCAFIENVSVPSIHASSAAEGSAMSTTPTACRGREAGKRRGERRKSREIIASNTKESDEKASADE